MKKVTGGVGVEGGVLQVRAASGRKSRGDRTLLSELRATGNYIKHRTESRKPRPAHSHETRGNDVSVQPGDATPTNNQIVVTAPVADLITITLPPGLSLVAGAPVPPELLEMITAHYRLQLATADTDQPAAWCIGGCGVQKQ